MNDYHRSHEDARNEFALRRRRPDVFLDSYLERVREEARRLIKEHPHLEGESPDRLFCRYISPETAPSFESVLRRSAFALLHLRAVDRAEMADFSSGGDAA